jgi:hypothetical protein
MQKTNPDCSEFFDTTMVLLASVERQSDGALQLDDTPANGNGNRLRAIAGA